MASTGELPEDTRVAKATNEIPSFHMTKDSAYHSLDPIDFGQTLLEFNPVQDSLGLDVEANFSVDFDYSSLQRPTAHTEPAGFFENEFRQDESQLQGSHYSDSPQMRQHDLGFTQLSVRLYHLSQRCRVI